MTETLKPCPFCGGEAVMLGKYYGIYQVECKKCGASTEEYYNDAETASKRWNDRPVDDYKVKYEPTSYSCSACKNATDEEIKQLKSENARLREALEFYAVGKGHIGYDEQTKEFYEAYDNGYGITEQPLGYEAREALKAGRNDSY